MVYSVRSNRPIIASKPLKMSKKRSEFVKDNIEFLKTHHVSIDVDENGNPVVNISEKK